METVAAVAFGGALGSVARYYLNNFVSGVAGTGFPWGIFVINVLGSFCMGLFIGAFTAFGNPSQATRALLTTGILGGFTTFSTFSLDTATLIERGAYGLAALYAGGSVVVAVGSLFLGMALMRAVGP